MNVTPVGKRGAETSFRLTHCQQRIDQEADGHGPSWLQLRRVLQNIPGKGIATLLGYLKEGTDVLVKVQLYPAARREYDIQQRLQHLPGVIQYHCFVACGGDKRYIQEYGPPLKPYQHVCTKKGSELGVILMPYLPMGSLEDYLKGATDRAEKQAVTKILVCKTILWIVRAYLEHGFTHGDLFTKNILLASNTEPVLIDFEKSDFDDRNKRQRVWRDIDALLGDVSRYMWKDELSDISQELVIIPLAYQEEPTIAHVDRICRRLRALGTAPK